jgi:hypothetical protein
MSTQQLSFHAVATRSTEQPSTVERLAHWFARSAPLRAAAELGQEHAMTAAPNISPMRKPTRIEAVIATICVHCRDRGYSRSVERDAADFAVLRLRNGASGSSAVRSGQLRADHLNDVYGSRKDAS